MITSGLVLEEVGEEEPVSAHTHTHPHTILCIKKGNDLYHMFSKRYQDMRQS